jgi:aconitase A
MTQLETQVDQVLETLVKDVVAAVHAMYRGVVRQQTAKLKTAEQQATARHALLNLVGMGVLPLEFAGGATAQSVGLTGFEQFDILGLDDSLKPKGTLTVRATGKDGARKEFKVVARIDTPEEMRYYRDGGILQYVLRNLAA